MPGGLPFSWASALHRRARSDRDRRLAPEFNPAVDTPLLEAREIDPGFSSAHIASHREESTQIITEDRGSLRTHMDCVPECGGQVVRPPCIQDDERRGQFLDSTNTPDKSSIVSQFPTSGQECGSHRHQESVKANSMLITELGQAKQVLDIPAIPRTVSFQVLDFEVGPDFAPIRGILIADPRPLILVYVANDRE